MLSTVVSDIRRKKALRYVRKRIARAKELGQKSVTIHFCVRSPLFQYRKIAPRFLASLGRGYTIEPAKDIHWGYVLKNAYTVSWE